MITEVVSVRISRSQKLRLAIKEIAIGTSSTRINEAIRAKELRVIGSNGEQIGIVSREEALRLAAEAGVDLVEISPTANPPVAKIVDWGKYQYQKMKEQQRNRRNNKAGELKQIRMGLKIGANDLNIKLRKVRSFIDDGNKVKIVLFFKGREMAHTEIGFQLIERVISGLGDSIVLEQKPQMAGRNLSIVVRSK
ncbi:MAG: translation initiation factor IF-3 [Candidatus Saccharimonadaceae bacterium]